MTQASSQKSIADLFRNSILPKSRLALEAATGEYQGGTVDYVTLVTAWREVLQVELQLAQVEAELGKALASLERAVGGQLNEHPPSPSSPDSTSTIPPPSASSGPFREPTESEGSRKVRAGLPIERLDRNRETCYELRRGMYRARKAPPGPTVPVPETRSFLMDESKTGLARKRRASKAPNLETLEGRRLMTAAPSQVGIREVTQKGYTELDVIGTNKGDTITINDNGTVAPGNISVNLPNGTTYTSKGGISVVKVQDGTGSDHITYNLTATLTTPRSVLVNLGAREQQLHREHHRRHQRRQRARPRSVRRGRR